MSLLTASNFAAGYGETDIITGIALEVMQGEIVTVAGSNGAGKSTFVKSILGLVPRMSGTLTFDGQDILKTSTEKRVALGISYVPQVRNVFPSLTVKENLQVVEGVSNRHERIAEILNLFPSLAGRLALGAGMLSGGERQQLAFARALMTRPKLVVLDEPTAALSPLLAQSVLDLVHRLPELGTAVLLVEQRAREALSISSRGYVLDSGRVVRSGTAEELLADEDLARVYLGIDVPHDGSAPSTSTTTDGSS